MQSLDRTGKLGSARTSVRDSECGVPDSGFKGAVIFQKIRDTGRPEGVRRIVRLQTSLPEPSFEHVRGVGAHKRPA